MIKAEIGIRVRYAETDGMGIVYHSRYFPWFESVRVQMLDDLDYPYVEMERRGVRLPVIEVHCRYRAPAYFDDRLQVVAEVREKPRARLWVHYTVSRGESLLCAGSTLHGFMDLENRPCRPPEDLRVKFEEAFPV